MTTTEREVDRSDRMTDLEAVMWSAERDPVLSSAMGSVLVLDAKPDLGRFTASMGRAARQIPRLRERVVEGLGVAPPRWQTDPAFDIANHVQFEVLDDPGDQRQLLDRAAEIFEEPFASGHPLWRFVVIHGSGSRRKSAIKGALVMKLHHSLSDGIGALRLAEMYLDLERDPAPVTNHEFEAENQARSNPLGQALGDVAHVMRRRTALARRGAAEVALWGADPQRARKQLRSLADMSGSMINQMVGADLGSAGSDLWASRSADRRLDVFDLPFDELRAAATATGGTINDVFVAGSVIAANRFHTQRELEVPRFNVSFVMSTRSDDKAGGNAFAPIAFTVATTPAADLDQFKLVKHAMATKRGDGGSHAASMEFAAAVSYGLPSSWLSRAGRSRAARLDWATSNLRGAPFAMFTAGAKIERMYPVGPTAGTAFNLTAISYANTMYFGLFSDRAAVDDPADLRDHLLEAYRSLAKGL